MKRVLIHVLQSPFVLVTSTAALIHSSWTLAIIFGGTEPAFGLGWIGWLIPGALLAISVDVGLLQVSTEIKDGRRDRSRLAAFIVLALAMFVLQLAYAITHFPALALSAGVRAEWSGALAWFRDSLIVIGPALLPIGIILHTFADSDHRTESAHVQSSSSALAIVPQDDQIRVEVPDPVEIECPKCAWAGTYPSYERAQMALKSHSKKHVNVRVE